MDTTENKQKYKCIDLGEAGGGKQIVDDVVYINENERYVRTFGYGPKIDMETGEPLQQQEKHVKLRFFHLLKDKDNLTVSECVIPEDIERIASLFNKDKN